MCFFLGINPFKVHQMSPSNNGTETTISDHHSLNCYNKNSSDQESSSGQFDSALGRKHLTEVMNIATVAGFLRQSCGC